MNHPQRPHSKSTLAAIDPRPRADHVMIGTTDSLCPECMTVVPAKIITRGQRVYFRKRCPQHGVREDFVCSDVRWWDRGEGHTASVLPLVRSTQSGKGCPHDCGLCEEHEQHTCIGLVELTDRCNLSCPMCFASSGPGGKDHSLQDIIASLDRLVECEGRAEVCQLSGGEPTIHPEFERVVDEALTRPIDYVMINTNGLRLAKDLALVERLANNRDRIEIYFQWDGSDRELVRRVRGEDVIDVKRRALDRLQQADLHVTLVSTLTAPLDEHFYRDLWAEALGRPNVTGLSLQPATFSGRHLLPTDLEDRVTFPDVIRGLANASGSMIREDDFTPLPCAHPNCHQIMLAARDGDRLAGLNQVGPVAENLDLIAGGISFTPERSKQLLSLFLDRMSHCGSDCGCSDLVSLGSSSESNSRHRSQEIDPVLERFFARVLAQQATAKDMMRVTITSFLDAYNFDVRQLMKCCTHHVLPSGHVVPFCAYNTLYRPGHLSLPPLKS
ncbi:molybdenum cofactor biosynthesis protein A [Novipirellula galeiformis]|uniref:Molybdenum cofactor biosynthesis protein A n=1 Tax=Novipirellula galeiformis TaxID=2528004 RepID=A0A5C6CHI2_9BACT|nr:radical SAM protein [Novipirellula galeiformis]TWU22189.1 molybdenum cofactor biosynthesis protein A [Novipirellula galeiformis]